MSKLLRYLIIIWLSFETLVSPQSVSAAEPSAREILASQLREWLSVTEGVDPSEISVTELDGRVRVPVCTDEFDFSFPFNDRSTVRVSCPSANWSVVTRVTLPRQAQRTPVQADSPRGAVTYALVNARPAGHILTAADIRAVTEPASARRNIGRAVNLGQLVGARLARDMPAAGTLQASDIQMAHRVLTVTSPLQRGSALTASNTQMMTFYGTLPADAVTSLNDLRRMVASTQLRPNQPVRLSSLRQLADVMRGDELQLSVSRGPVTIETAVIALSDGVIGEQIEVQNPESGETFRVIITDVGRAQPR
jgi:flagella basal body P-ring formation protein FlgA